METPQWPLFALRIVTPRIELRYADDTALAELAGVAADGIHDPGEMPFLTPWSDAAPAERARSVMQWNWRNRAELTAESWRLTFVTVVDGAVVGTQDIVAKQFAVLREFETGSWLGRRHQGNGIGTEMRAAILHLGFAGLGAEFALTAAFGDNARSLGVTRKLGYDDDGIARLERRGAPAVERRFRLGRAGWLERQRADIEIFGLTDEVKQMLGAA